MPSKSAVSVLTYVKLAVSFVLNTNRIIVKNVLVLANLVLMNAVRWLPKLSKPYFGSAEDTSSARVSSLRSQLFASFLRGLSSSLNQQRVYFPQLSV